MAQRLRHAGLQSLSTQFGGVSDCKKCYIWIRKHRKCTMARPAAAEDREQNHTKVQERMKELMQEDPETHARLERVRKAAAAVAELQAQKSQLDEEIRAANQASAWASRDQEARQAQRAASRGANEDVFRAADEMEKAQTELRAAGEEQAKWSAVAANEAEKFESAKAGLVGGAGATIGSLPFVVASASQPLLSAATVASIFLAGLLFGVTYRYVIRQDIGNQQLKGGVVGAFGLVRGLALAEEVVKGAQSSGTGLFDAETLGAAAIASGESVICIGFAAVAMEVAFQRSIVKLFGSPRNNSQPTVSE